MHLQRAPREALGPPAPHVLFPQGSMLESELSLPLVGLERPFPEAAQAHPNPAPLKLRERFALALQRLIGHFTVVVYAPLVVLLLRRGMGYRFHNLEATRKRFQNILATTRGPLLICPNHLTMIDSAILAWGLASPWRYAFQYRLLPWNVPESTNFANPFVRVFCYLAKCLPIHRGGTRGAQQAVLSKCQKLLREGHPVLVFPEGRRSRTGRIDSDAMAHAVGRLARSVPDCKVLCVYLRGDGQTGYSYLPKRGESFSMDLRLITPRTDARGVRGSREVTTQVLAELAAMEQAYYARRQRCR